MIRSLTRLSTLAALVLALSLPASAGPAEDEAERVRLSEDMKRLSRRSAWQGVDDAYRALAELAARGTEIPQEDYLLGAEAARNLGNVQGAYERLIEARKVRPSPDVTGRIEAIESAYGQAVIVVESKYDGEATLAAVEMPFAADQRKAITYAQGQVQTTRGFSGMLPFGDYTIGPKTFTVAQNAPASVSLTAEDGVQKEKGLAFVGPRVDIGPAFTVMGDASYKEGELHPDGFSGAGGRAGVGLELGMHGGFGALVQVGWHGAFSGPPDVAEDPAYSASSRSLNMGFGWLAATYRVGDLGIALGPLLAAGVGKSSGLSGYCDGQPCTGVDATEAAALDYPPMTGSIVSAGGSLGLSYGVLDLGGLQLGVGLQAGAQTDNRRLYPWGQLGLTLAPQRSDG